MGKQKVVVADGPYYGTAKDHFGRYEGQIVGFTTWSCPFRQFARLLHVESDCVIFKALHSGKEITVPHSEIEIWPKPFDEDTFQAWRRAPVDGPAENP